MRLGCFVGLLVIAAAATANAGIIGTPFCQADSDGAVVCQPSVWDGATNTLSIVEGMQRSPAHVQGEFQTDGDPTVWVLKTVENHTGSTWTGYHFNIFMDQAFTINSSSQPVGWTPNVTPASSGSFTDTDGRTWGFWGAVDYVANAPAYYIPNLGSGDFGAKLTFGQTVQFEVEQIGVVPEPVSLALLALGGLLIRRNRK